MELVLDRTYRAYRYFLDNVVGYAAAIIMVGAVTLAVVEIIRRYIFGLTYEWGQDAIVYCTVASIYLYFAVTQGRRSHLAVTALLDVFKTRGLHKLVLVLRTIVTAFAMTLYAGIVYWGWPSMERSLSRGVTTQSMLLEVWPFQLLLLIGFGLMAVTCLFQLYQDIQALRGKTVFAWAPAEEGLEV
jgi:TRAP-type C4-dicarboxylate transport system permease small subunit